MLSQGKHLGNYLTWPSNNKTMQIAMKMEGLAYWESGTGRECAEHLSRLP